MERDRFYELLRRSPAGPEFTQSTITFCEEAISLSLSKIKEILSQSYPSLSAEIDQKLTQLSAPRYLPSSQFVKEGSSLYLKTPREKLMLTNRIMEAVFYAEPGLGIFEYGIRLYPPRNPQEAKIYQRYPWFNNRLGKIMEIGQLSYWDKPIQIIAVGYLTQVGKNFAVDHSKTLLKKISYFGGIARQEQVMPYLDTIEHLIAPIKRDEAFIKKGLDTIDLLAKEAGFGKDHIQALLDLAFIRNKAFDAPQEFKRVLEPLIRLMAEGNWPELYHHRNFLLNYFANSFPDWRVADFQFESGQVSLTDFKSLARAIHSGQIMLDESDIPQSYQEYFQEFLPKKLNRVERERELEIIKKSLSLSNTVVKELARATSYLELQTSLDYTFGDKAEVAIRANFDQFLELAEEVNPEMGFTEAKILFQRKEGKLRGISQTPLPPFEVRTPNLARILYVDLRNNNQVFWTPLDYPREVIGEGGGVEFIMREPRSFSDLIYRLIQASFSPNPERPALDSQTLKETLQRAYQLESRQNSKIFFSLADYLIALINRSIVPAIDQDSGQVKEFARNI